MKSNASTGHNPATELALLGVLALLWGSSYLLIKVAVADIPPLSLVAFRVSLAGALLLAVMHMQGERFPKDAHAWRLLLLQSFLNSLGPWILLAWGQQFVASGLAGVLNSTSPIFVFLITLTITRHESVGPAKLGGALLGMLGVVLIIGTDALQGLGEQLFGQLAVLASAILYAVAAINGKRLGHLAPTVSAAATMLIAALILAPLSLVFDRPWTLRPSTEAIMAATALAVFSTGLALLIYFRLVRTLGSMGVTSQSYLRAGISVLLGILILDEHLTASVAVGLVAAILGVAAINLNVAGLVAGWKREGSR
jgi:drug/metabolite transporter (DMT)-like permease